MRILLLLMVFLLGTTQTQAQFSDSSFIETQSSLVLQPTHPGPQESYTVTLDDYGGGFYGAQIRWYLNGALLDQTNQRSITLTSGKAGSTDVVKAVLTTQSGVAQTLSATVAPRYLDIIVEPQTHVPNFYQGRALPSVGSTVNLTALVGGTAANAASYIYTWRVNDKVLDGGPLRGRNEISFLMPQDSYSTISLQVSSLDGTIVAKRNISLPSVPPKLLFYEVSTLYGIESLAMTNSYSLIGNSGTLRAEPYFLSSRVFNAPDIITWIVANEEIGTPSANPYEVTLQKTGSLGATNIGFHVRSTDILLQGARKTIKVSI